MTEMELMQDMARYALWAMSFRTTRDNQADLMARHALILAEEYHKRSRRHVTDQLSFASVPELASQFACA